MKAILLVLFVGVLSCSAGLLKRKSHQASLSNAADNDALNWGWGQVIQKAQASGKVQGDVPITSINSWKKSTGAGTGYDFDVTGNNGKGTTVNAVFSVYVTGDGKKTLSSYNYKTSTSSTTSTSYTTTATTSTAWTNANQSAADVQNALNYGIQQVLAVGQKSGKVPQSNYYVESLNSAQTRNNGNNKEYQFDVVLSNGFDARVTATFTVVVSSNGQSNLSAYNYSVKTGRL